MDEPTVGSPGPWRFDEAASGDSLWVVDANGDHVVDLSVEAAWNREAAERHARADARLIASAPALAAEVERLKAENAKLRDRASAEREFASAAANDRADMRKLADTAEGRIEAARRPLTLRAEIAEAEVARLREALRRLVADGECYCLDAEEQRAKDSCEWCTASATLAPPKERP